MSTEDQLSGKQFMRRMPMSEILKLHSIDYPGTVGEMIAHRAGAPVKYPGNREALRSDMEQYGQRNPVLVQGAMLTNGGSRVMHAHSLGWKDMTVTSKPLLSDDPAWEDEHYGYEVAPGYKVDPAYANPEDYEVGRVTGQEQKQRQP